MKCCIVGEDLEKLVFSISDLLDSLLKHKSWRYSLVVGYNNEKCVKPLISTRKTGMAGAPLPEERFLKLLLALSI